MSKLVNKHKLNPIVGFDNGIWNGFQTSDEYFKTNSFFGWESDNSCYVELSKLKEFIKNQISVCHFIIKENKKELKKVIVNNKQEKNFKEKIALSKGMIQFYEEELKNIGSYQREGLNVINDKEYIHLDSTEFLLSNQKLFNIMSDFVSPYNDMIVRRFKGLIASITSTELIYVKAYLK